MTLPEAFDAAVSAFPNRIALVCGDERRSLTELREAAGAIRSALVARGVRQGDRVALVAPNGVGYAAALFGLVMAGATAVPLDVRLVPAETERLVTIAEARFAVVDDRQCVAGSRVPLRGVLEDLVGSARTVPINSSGEVDSGRRSARPVSCATPITSRDLAVIFCTSGTTGRPKLVRHSHRALVASVVALHELHASFFDAPINERVRRALTLACRHGIKLVRTVGQQVWMTPISFSAISGHEVLLAALLGGHRLVTMPSFRPKAAVNVIGRERVNIFAGTPTMAELLLTVRDVRREDFASLLMVGLGGGPASPDLVERIRRRFRCRVSVGYGSTELGGGVLVSRLYDPLAVQRETVGRPFPGTEIRIVDVEGRDVTPGTIGELLCRSASTACSDENAPTRREGNGWVRTGDLATSDGAGNVCVVGRKDDVIIRAGQNVYPVEAERVIERVAGVARCAVVGVPNGPGGMQVWAFVETTSDATLARDEILRACSTQLASFKVPDHVRLVTNVPTTADGKVQRFRLVELARAEKLSFAP